MSLNYSNLSYLSPSQRREAPCEGTNSARPFTPGKKESIAKSEVHQISRALGSRVVVSWSGLSSLISKIWRTILHYNISYFCKKILATFTTNEGWSFLILGIWWTIRSSKHLRHSKRPEIRRKRLPQDS